MGAKLDFTKIREHLERVPAGFADRVAQVGWFPSAKYEDGTPVAYVATVQEYGAPEVSIPPRPFMRPTVEQSKAAWMLLMRQGVLAVAEDRVTADEVLEGVGLQTAGDIRKAIASVTSPALSPTTLMLRKWRREGRKITGKTVGEAAAAVAAGESVAGVNADPLRDTGLMIATLTNAVGDAE